ncbi:MAG: hypothetical protein P8080_06045 [Gammaproteobacteria bacterium]
MHWAFAAYFGSGWYVAGDRQEVYALRITPRWQVAEWRRSRDAGPVTLQLRLPLTVGLYSLDVRSPEESVDIDNLAAASLTPGLVLDWPVTSRWTLRPQVYAGWGSELDGEEEAWIYWTGVKSRYALGRTESRWTLLNGLAYLGHEPSEGRSSDFGALMAGLEFGADAPFQLPGGGPLRLHWHGIYTAYVDPVRFRLGSLRDSRIAEEWEFGVSAGGRREAIQIWRLSFDRLGLAYRFTSSGKFQGISLVFNSVFER